jgi:hypothetical protein
MVLFRSEHVPVTFANIFFTFIIDFDSEQKIVQSCKFPYNDTCAHFFANT